MGRNGRCRRPKWLSYIIGFPPGGAQPDRPPSGVIVRPFGGLEKIQSASRATSGAPIEATPAAPEAYGNRSNLPGLPWIARTTSPGCTRALKALAAAPAANEVATPLPEVFATSGDKVSGLMCRACPKAGPPVANGSGSPAGSAAA